MKTAIATIFYNNPVTELKRLVNSVPDKIIDTWIWIDGIFKYTKEKYPELPELTPIDTLLDSIMGKHHYHTEHIFLYKPNSTEFEKRNAYLTACKELDIDLLLIVDTDGYFSNLNKDSWVHFINQLEYETKMDNYKHNVYAINTINAATNSIIPMPRVWFKPYEMSYIQGSHYKYANLKTDQENIKLYKKHKSCYTQSARKIITKGDIKLIHDHSLRTPEQQKIREEYQKYLVTYESYIQSQQFTEQRTHEIAKRFPSKTFVPIK